MTYIRSFPPIADPGARILILGSMPGKESLRAQQYYAHPRNAFWPIMGELTGALPSLPYALRTQKLREAGIALWDVLATCIRTTSLDADIVTDSILPNDFAVFLRQHPHIERVYFNGALAEQSFRRLVLPHLDLPLLRLQRLPSTSPANATLRYEQKLQAWHTALQPLYNGASR